MAIPVDVGDVMRIILRGRMPTGDEMLNVFHCEFYAGSGTDVGSHLLENFAFGFWENIKTPLRAMVGDAFSFEQVDAIKLDADFNQINGESFIIPAGEQPGSVGAEYMPNFVVASFKYVRPAIGWRHGWKRFSGITETIVFGNTLTAGGLAQANTLAAALAADIGGLYPDGSPLVDPPDARPIVYRARWNGDDLSPVEFDSPASVVFSGLGSQNTRK